MTTPNQLTPNLPGIDARAAAPTCLSPSHWHRYIRSARTLTDATNRMEEAVIAGVDFAAMP